MLAILAVAGCGASDASRYDSGHGDGYAAGFNTTCEIRSTMIAGDWDDEDYTRGYHDGYADGAADCVAQRSSGNQ